MAGVGEEEVDYESDPEEATLSLTMRRREASDDEDEDEDEEEEIETREMPPRRIDSRVSDCESDGEGAAAEYDDEESEIEEEELEEDGELEEEHQYTERESGSDVKAVPVELDEDGGRSVGELLGTNQVEEDKKVDDGLNNGGVYLQDDQFGDKAAADRTGGEEKKENEPFAVPTAGAFYMHDDRFRDSAGGRHRCVF